MRTDRSIPAGRPGGIRRQGTTLILAAGRHVRVLTLPRVCGQRLLTRHWDDCFGTEESDDGLVVWWPEAPDPSRN